MKTIISTLTMLLFAGLIFIFTSCNTLDDVDNIAISNVLERTDMTISGNVHYDDFNQSLQSDMSKDLITYNYFGDPSEKFDFKIHLANGNVLMIKIIDEEGINPWEQVGKPYNIYPSSELGDKLSYVQVYLFSSGDEVLYSDILNTDTPLGTSLDVFQIISSNDNGILCRMRDIKLYNGSTDADNSIIVNGTFVGALTF